MFSGSHFPTLKKEGAGCSTPVLSPSLTVDRVRAQHKGIKGGGILGPKGLGAHSFP